MFVYVFKTCKRIVHLLVAAGYTMQCRILSGKQIIEVNLYGNA